MSWFDPAKREAAARVPADSDGAGFKDEVIVELTKGQPEAVEADGDHSD